MSGQLPTKNPTGYFGIRETNVGQLYFKRRDPINSQDFRPYTPGDRWINTAADRVWTLVRKDTTSGTWVGVTAGPAQITQITPDIGGAIVPVMNNVNILGDGTDRIVTTATAIDTISLSLANTPSFSAYAIAQANVTGDGTSYTVTFNTVEFNVGGCFDGVSTFTAPVDGKYLLGATASLTNVGAGFDEFDLHITTSSGDLYLDTCSPGNNASAGSFYKSTGFTMIELSAGDTAVVNIFVAGIGGKTIGVSTNMHFYGALYS